MFDLGQFYENLRMNLHKTYDQRNKKNAIPSK